MRRFTTLLLFVVVISGVSASGGVVAAEKDTIPKGAERAVVVSVTDGDTIKVRRDGSRRTETVRLLLVDAPETLKPGNPRECFGREATKRTRVMLPEGRAVYLEKDISNTESARRLLRYVWFKGVKGGVYLANEILLREGYAEVAAFSPNVKRVDRLRDAEGEAIDQQAGLWAECGGAHTPIASAPTPTVSEPVPAPLITDCSVFASFDEAQVYYADNPGATDLDPNYDGRACEVYFGVDAVSVPAPGPPADGGSSGGSGSPGGSTGGGARAGFGGFDGVDYDCSDFGWDEAAATAYFVGDGGSAGNNVDGLDDNYNGVACEPGEG